MPPPPAASAQPFVFGALPLAQTSLAQPGIGEPSPVMMVPPPMIVQPGMASQHYQVRAVRFTSAYRGVVSSTRLDHLTSACSDQRPAHRALRSKRASTCAVRRPCAPRSLTAHTAGPLDTCDKYFETEALLKGHIDDHVPVRPARHTPHSIVPLTPQ